MTFLFRFDSVTSIQEVVLLMDLFLFKSAIIRVAEYPFFSGVADFFMA